MPCNMCIVKWFLILTTYFVVIKLIQERIIYLRRLNCPLPLTKRHRLVLSCHSLEVVFNR